jgi:hypothetical protein
MSANGIFLDTGGALTVLRQQPYEAEAVLQQLLAQYPELIAGPTTLSPDAARLLLISREAPIPKEEGGGRTWSIDHLFVDTGAVPVFVEVKRSSDTRSRREVVAQMLDYAAHGVRYLPIRQLQAGLDGTAAELGHPDGAALLAAVGVADPDVFWQEVAANLDAGRVRLVFVADELSGELRRIIEFLNEQMRTAEVLGVELRQFVADGHAAYVPTVFGRTETAVDAKGVPAGRVWDEPSFLETAETRCSAAEVSIIRRLLRHIRDHAGELRWGGSPQNPGVGGWYPADGERRPVWRLHAKNAGAQFQFDVTGLQAAFGPARVAAMSAHLAAVPTMKGWPAGARATLSLPDIAGDAHQEAAFFAALDVVVS